MDYFTLDFSFKHDLISLHTGTIIRQCIQSNLCVQTQLISEFFHVWVHNNGWNIRIYDTSLHFQNKVSQSNECECKSLKPHMMYEHGSQSSKANSRLILVVQIVFICVYFVSISAALDIVFFFVFWEWGPLWTIYQDLGSLTVACIGTSGHGQKRVESCWLHSARRLNVTITSSLIPVLIRKITAGMRNNGYQCV